MPSAKSTVGPARRESGDHTTLGHHGPSVVVPVRVLTVDGTVVGDELTDRRVARFGRGLREGDIGLDDGVGPEGLAIDLERRPRFASEIVELRPVDGRAD